MSDPYVNLPIPASEAKLDVKLPLIRGLHEAIAAGYADGPLDYQRAVRAAMSGRFPAEQAPNGRWWVLRSDLRKMAAAIAAMPTRGRATPVASASAHAAA